MLRSIVVIALAGLTGVGSVFGQDPSTELRTGYPNKPIRFLTAPVGGGIDFAARIVAQGISGRLGQPVIVDNRVTILASEIASQAPPDGYSLLVIGSTLFVYPILYKSTFSAADFSPVSQITREISVLAVHPSLPVKSVGEFIALAKAKPGGLNYSSGGIGGPSHLSVELFKSMAGVNIVHVPYKGGAAAITALISNEVQLTINDVGSLAPHVKSGRVKALAVTSAKPSVLAPGLPTVGESGLPGYEMVGMTNIYAPAKTPAAVINRLNQEIVRLLNQGDVKEKFFSSGVEVAPSSPAELAATMKIENAKMTKVIRDVGIHVD